MVQVRFEEFDFHFSPECNQDYLEINGVRYCGNQLKGVASEYNLTILLDSVETDDPSCSDFAQQTKRGSVDSNGEQ